MSHYVVATVKDWNIANFYKLKERIPTFHLAIFPWELQPLIKAYQPRYVFFPHWSALIRKEIYNNSECVGFHMTDLPFGRGGSPLQNLISRGISETKISAFKIAEGLDEGDIYLKRDLCLNGSAEEIYMRASDIVFDMIDEVVRTEPTPILQQGEAVVFKRRTLGESQIPHDADLNKVFDWIRMLDAEHYPRAYAEVGNLRFEFSRASLKSDCVLADVKISLKATKGV